MSLPTLPPRSVADLFGPLQVELVSLLRGLEPADWERPTIGRTWRVKDVAAHVLDGQLRRLSFQRDGWPVPPPGTSLAVAFATPIDAAYTLQAGAAGWTLHAGAPSAPAASIRLDPETAWRLFTRSLPLDELRARALTTGDERWTEPFLRVRAMMV